MYGHMLIGLGGFLKQKFGSEVWTQSCKNAGLGDSTFFTYEVYNEDLFYVILDAACGILGIAAEVLLYDFGYYTFSVYWRNSKHDTLLYGLGDNLHELIQNLNALHHHLSSKYDKMIAPSFTCDVEPDGLVVHYHSYRPKLGEYVRGILIGLASHVYRLNVRIESLEHKRLSSGEGSNYYYKFKITLNGLRDEGTLLRLQGSKEGKIRSLVELRKLKANFHVVEAADGSEIDPDPHLSTFTTDEDWPITPEIFDSIASYHLIFDTELRIVLMSSGFVALFNADVSLEEVTINDLFDLEIPRISLTHANVMNELNALFILSVKNSMLLNRNTKPSFRGQMLPVRHSLDSPILFLASPSANNFEQLNQMGISIGDIGKGNALHELLQKYDFYGPQMDLPGKLERAKHQLEFERREVERARGHTDEILHRMLPVQVANDLKSDGFVTPMEFTQVSILFTAIYDFQTICKESTPHQIVTLLNNLFTRFDNLLEKYQVYKVETVADSYMMTAGLPNTAEKHAQAVTNMAFDMRREAEELTNIQVRIGIHSGPVVTGVIGTRQPRYCLFGDTVNTASRMNSTGEPGKIHISEATYKHICDDCSYTFLNRGGIEVKGLGLRTTYFVEECLFQSISNELFSNNLVQEKRNHTKLIKSRRTSQVSPLVHHSSRHHSHQTNSSYSRHRKCVLL